VEGEGGQDSAEGAVDTVTRPGTADSGESTGEPARRRRRRGRIRRSTEESTPD
jgi:hypothetical protein